MKKILAIVLSVCLIAGLCIGISLSGSADPTNPVLPEKLAGAPNYAALSTAEGYQNNTAGLPVIDEENNIIELPASGNGFARAEFDLEGLTATDDYVITFSAATFANWLSPTWGLRVAMDSQNGTINRAQSLVFAGTNNHRFAGDDATDVASFSRALYNTVEFAIYVDADATTNTRVFHVYVGGEWVYTSPAVAAIEPQLALCGNDANRKWTVSNLYVYKVGEAGHVEPADPSVNLAVDASTEVSQTGDFSGVLFDKTTAALPQTSLKGGTPTVVFATSKLDDEYVVSFTAEFGGGWESNGLKLNFGEEAIIKLVKGSADTSKTDPDRAAIGGELYFNEQLIKSGDMRAVLTHADVGAEIALHVYPSATADKSDIDFYFEGTKLGTMTAVATSTTIKIGTIVQSWGDHFSLSDVKIHNGDANVPTTSTSSSTSSSTSASTSGSTASTSGSTASTSGSTASTSGSASTTPSTTPTVPVAGPNVNLAVDANTNRVIFDKAGTGTQDLDAADFLFPDHRDAVVGVDFQTQAGALDDEYTVSFNAVMNGGWETNGVVLTIGPDAVIKLVKAHSIGGELYFNNTLVTSGDMRGALVSADGAEFVAHVYPNDTDEDLKDVDFYFEGVLMGQLKGINASNTISIKSVTGAWGDKMLLTDVKIMNNTDAVPTSTSASTSGSTASTSGSTASTSGSASTAPSTTPSSGSGSASTAPSTTPSSGSASTPTSGSEDNTTAPTTAPTVPVADPNTNLAEDDDTNRVITDKAGTAAWDNGNINFEHRDAPVGVDFQIPAGALDDEFVVSFTAAMNGGWESNGIKVVLGDAEIKLVKAHAIGGELYFNDTLVASDNMRAALVSSEGADFMLHVKDGNIDVYYEGVLMGTIENATVSDTVSIKTVVAAWGDKLNLSNIKIQNGTVLLPGSGNDTTTSDDDDTDSTTQGGDSSSTTGKDDTDGTTTGKDDDKEDDKEDDKTDGTKPGSGAENSGNTDNSQTGNASNAVAALAVTAAIALPIIIVSKKKRQEW